MLGTGKKRFVQKLVVELKKEMAFELTQSLLNVKIKNGEKVNKKKT